MLKRYSWYYDRPYKYGANSFTVLWFNTEAPAFSVSSLRFYCAIPSRTKFKSTKTGRCFPHSVTRGQVRMFEQGRNITFYKECPFWQLATNKKIYHYWTPICKFPFGKAFIAPFIKTHFDLNLSCKSVVWQKKKKNCNIRTNTFRYLWLFKGDNDKFTEKRKQSWRCFCNADLDGTSLRFCGGL